MCLIFRCRLSTCLNLSMIALTANTTNRKETMNKLYYGDNLEMLRDHIADESVDLIYLDPPFNSSANYNVLFKEADGSKSAAQIQAFEDTWHWGRETQDALDELLTTAPPKVSMLLEGLHGFLGGNDMMAYLVFMTQRLIELHRVLKDTGSLYLHCDPTASHYIKLVLDAVFGGENFKNEIIWAYSPTGAGPKNAFHRKHDTIFFYGKTANSQYNRQYGPISEGTLKRFSSQTDEYGRQYRDIGGKRTYLDENKGRTIPDWWNDIPAGSQMSKRERLGYPTQKPVSLLERIIKASSNEGDVVLDPFCGCGTAIDAAVRLNRRWIGMDITHLAVNVMKYRLLSEFGVDPATLDVTGEPVDEAGAEALAEQDRYEFQYWALGKIGAQPLNDKKGADKGVDGIITFMDNKKSKRIIVQVKSGGVKRNDIATLHSDMQREKAEMAVFLTLKPSTKPMRDEAVSARYYTPEQSPGDKYRRIQILTIKELLAKTATVQYPRSKERQTI